MRAWSLHPKYLDRVGLWRCYNEVHQCLLAQLGLKKMHRNHPQAQRFKDTGCVQDAMSAYLLMLWIHASARNCLWNESNLSRVVHPYKEIKIPVTTGQIAYEVEHLQNKLLSRKSNGNSAHLAYDYVNNNVELHPLFYAVPGPIEPWEKVKG